MQVFSLSVQTIFQKQHKKTLAQFLFVQELLYVVDSKYYNVVMMGTIMGSRSRDLRKKRRKLARIRS